MSDDQCEGKSLKDVQKQGEMSHSTVAYRRVNRGYESDAYCVCVCVNTKKLDAKKHWTPKLSKLIACLKEAHVL